MISEETAIVFTGWSYVFITGGLVVLALMMTIKTRWEGLHAKGWFLFACMAVIWFMAEMTWLLYEHIYEVDPWASEADYLWVVGYFFYFGFLIFYLFPFKKSISKRMVLVSLLLSLALLVPSLYVSYDSELALTDLENVFALSYPFLDAMVFVPALIGIMLFLTGKVNLLWTLMCVAIFCDIVADAAFLFTTLDETYYSGHPVEILFQWSYILFAFGVYNHYKIFK